MDNKNISLEQLNIILPPIKEIIENISDTLPEIKAIAETTPDWNENDPTSLKYIQNRPFYTDADGITHYISEEYLPIKGIVSGAGYNSEVFNKGSSTHASGNYSHAEGYNTKTMGTYSHAEGYNTTASGSKSHAEGSDTTASGGSSHAEGLNTTAGGGCSHAEGDYTTASDYCTHAEGEYTIAAGRNQHVQGKYNIEDDDNKYAHIVGNGAYGIGRSNAHTLDWDGNAWFSGDVYTGSTSGTNKDDGSKKLATEEYVNTKVNNFKSTPFIEGSGTTDSTAKTSTWIGNSDEITEYYDGLTIKYKIGVAGQSTVTLNINNLGAKTVYRFNTTKLTTQFPVGSIINLIYHTDLNGGCWITNDYDANTNTYQRVYISDSKNVEYPITARYNTTTGETYYAEYGRYSTGVTLNPSKNTITATTFNGDLNGTATKATQDSHGNVIVDTYATKSYVQQEFTSKALTLTGIDADGIFHTWTIYGVAQ